MEKWQVIIAACAVAVSIVSIILTIVTIRNQKVHNYKSVKPIAHITVGDYENDIDVSIINNGIGPMLIQSFRASNNRLSSDANLIDIIPDEINKQVVWTDFMSSIVNRALKPGDRMYLLRLKFEEGNMDSAENQSIKKAIRDFLQYITIEVTYTDIYEKNKYEQKRKLDWFGRHSTERAAQKQQYHGNR